MAELWWWIGIGMAVVVAGFLWWWVPKRQMRSTQLVDPKERADVEDNFRKTVGQGLAGVAVLVGATLAYSGTLLTLRESDAQSRLSANASRALLISQQVSKGFEQLVSSNIVMRLGGIYALEGVMNTSSEYYQPILAALCGAPWPRCSKRSAKNNVSVAPAPQR
jgi:hypothetical protein